MTLRVIRAALTGFLLVAAFALSFGALRHRAVEAEIIHGALATVLWGGLSVHTQAGIWALSPDVLAAVGIVGLRIDRSDPRAWVALILGLGLTLTFQVWSDPWAPLLRAVPAAAGAIAVWIMEVPWKRTTDDDGLEQLEEQREQVEEQISRRFAEAEAAAEWLRIRRQASQSRMRAIAAGATVITLTNDEWVARIEEYAGLCAYCGSEAKPVSMDHRIPVTRGGQHTLENVLPACTTCNTSKGDRDEEEFRAYLAKLGDAPTIRRGTDYEALRRAWTTGSDVLAIGERRGLDRRSVEALMDRWAARTTARPRWDPLPPPPPEPEEPANDPAQDPTPVAPEDPGSNEPPPKVGSSTRSRVAQDGPRRGRPAALDRPVDQVVQRAAQGHSAARIARDLGLSDRARRTWVGDLVRTHRPTPAQVGHRNGQGP